MHPFRTFVAAVVCAFLCNSLPAALSLPPEKPKWSKADAGEFHIYSNASERDTRRVVEELIRMRDAIATITHLNVHAPLPVNVYLFRDRASFAPYRDAIMHRKDAPFSGLFLPARDAKFALITVGGQDGSDRIIYHELTHYFIANTVAGLPLWLNEGLAEYYSTFKTRGTDVEIGHHVPQHILTLRDEPFIPLSRLFVIDHQSPEYNESRRQGMFYAESWALVHYLLIGSETRRDQLPRFLSLLNAGKSTDEAFRTAFAASYDDLERELRMYVRHPLMGYRRFSFKELPVVAVPPVHEISRADVLYALGNLLIHAGPGLLADGQTFLNEAVRLEPAHAPAHAALAAANAFLNRDAEAIAELEKAIAANNADPQIYLLYGNTLLEQAQRDAGNPAVASAAGFERARHMFERATELDPASARAWAGIGATYIVPGGDVSAGIAALEKSLSLAAAQDDAAFNLVQLYARAGRRVDAQRIVDTVLAKSADPELIRQARQAVVYADVKRAEELLKSGKHEEAVAVAKAALNETTNEGVKAFLNRLISTAGEQSVRTKQIDTINSAIRQANAHQYDTALRILDDLLPQITDADMKARVEKLRGEIAARRRK